ncbi:LysE family translocator [Ostreibacterium oceani]|uniref:LysE family translocator n=1 Tax=Ostreibacterium oceani TaxID=2654998 RepID=A0A6N7F0E0_9GAMM|nr:LysE family translocator [Ostreibacterium oceani]MPV86248.1 LysE family translocator [Ostreibacterium oceani]
MENYLLFLLIAVITVLSPGPGVVLTLTNTIRYGTKGAIGGILGIAFGTFIVAGVSATSLGILLMTSSLAFTIMKFVGAAYLIYLGIKLWRSPAISVDLNNATYKNRKLQFLEGLTLQLTNPKAVFFFMSVFPQFIDFTEGFTTQFIILVVTYSSLVVCIHLVYSLLARSARGWLASEKGGRIISRFSGGTFMCFGVGLATASK